MGDCAIVLHWRNIVAGCAKWCNFPTGSTSVFDSSTVRFLPYSGVMRGKRGGLFGVDGILKRKKGAPGLTRLFS